MMLTLLLSLSLATTPPPLTLGAVRASPPEAAGDALLQGRTHGRVEKIAPAERHGMDPPGALALALFEHPVAVPGGCTRQRWTANFRQAPDAPESSAIFLDARPATEVALPHRSGCAKAGYVHVNPGMSAQDGLAALAFLGDLRAGRSALRYSCADETRSGLCRSDRHMRQELARLPAWAVTKDRGETEMWLGMPGQIVTAIRFSETERNRVTIRRSIPAPFEKVLVSPCPAMSILRGAPYTLHIIAEIATFP